MTPAPEPVAPMQAMLRGFRMRCPHCGKGHLFGRFLKVADRCEVCGEDYTHQRADDFPAYLVILVVGHVVVPTALAIETAYAPPIWLQLLIWLPLTLFSALALLQPTKGAVVALQWQAGMHGFEAAKRLRDARPAAPPASQLATSPCGPAAHPGSR
jgi:uncharacterized protein (DUF983 family)